MASSQTGNPVGSAGAVPRSTALPVVPVAMPKNGNNNNIINNSVASTSKKSSRDAPSKNVSHYIPKYVPMPKISFSDQANWTISITITRDKQVKDSHVPDLTSEGIEPNPGPRLIDRAQLRIVSDIMTEAKAHDNADPSDFLSSLLSPTEVQIEFLHHFGLSLFRPLDHIAIPRVITDHAWPLSLDRSRHELLTLVAPDSIPHDFDRLSDVLRGALTSYTSELRFTCPGLWDEYNSSLTRDYRQLGLSFSELNTCYVLLGPISIAVSEPNTIFRTTDAGAEYAVWFTNPAGPGSKSLSDNLKMLGYSSLDRVVNDLTFSLSGSRNFVSPVSLCLSLRSFRITAGDEDLGQCQVASTILLPDLWDADLTSCAFILPAEERFMTCDFFTRSRLQRRMAAAQDAEDAFSDLPARVFDPELLSVRGYQAVYNSFVPAPMLVGVEPNPGPSLTVNDQFIGTPDSFYPINTALVPAAAVQLTPSPGMSFTLYPIRNASSPPGFGPALPIMNIVTNPAGNFYMSVDAYITTDEALAPYFLIYPSPVGLDALKWFVATGSGGGYNPEQALAVPLNTTLVHTPNGSGPDTYRVSTDQKISNTQSGCYAYMVFVAPTNNVPYPTINGIAGLNFIKFSPSYQAIALSNLPMPTGPITIKSTEEEPVYILNPPLDYISIGTGVYGGIPVPVATTVNNLPNTVFDVRAVGSSTGEPLYITTGLTGKVAVDNFGIPGVPAGFTVKTANPLDVDIKSVEGTVNANVTGGNINVTGGQINATITGGRSDVDIVSFAEQTNPVWISTYSSAGPVVANTSNVRVLASEADAHNSEMHASNGNISTYYKGNSDSYSSLVDSTFQASTLTPFLIFANTPGGFVQTRTLLGAISTIPQKIGGVYGQLYADVEPGVGGPGYEAKFTIETRTPTGSVGTTLYEWNIYQGFLPPGVSLLATPFDTGPFIIPADYTLTCTFQWAGYNSPNTYIFCPTMNLSGAEFPTISSNVQDVNLVAIDTQTGPLWVTSYSTGQPAIQLPTASASSASVGPTNKEMHSYNGNILVYVMDLGPSKDVVSSFSSFVNFLLDQVEQATESDSLVKHDCRHGLLTAVKSLIESTDSDLDRAGSYTLEKTHAASTLTRFRDVSSRVLGLNPACFSTPALDLSDVLTSKEAPSRSPSPTSSAKASSSEDDSTGIKQARVGKSLRNKAAGGGGRSVARRIAEKLADSSGRLNWQGLTMWVVSKCPSKAMLSLVMDEICSHYPKDWLSLDPGNSASDFMSSLSVPSPATDFVWCLLGCTEAENAIHRLGLSNVALALSYPSLYSQFKHELHQTDMSESQSVSIVYDAYCSFISYHTRRPKGDLFSTPLVSSSDGLTTSFPQASSERMALPHMEGSSNAASTPLDAWDMAADLGFTPKDVPAPRLVGIEPNPGPDGYSQYLQATANRRAHSTNGNTSTHDMTLTSVSAKGLQNLNDSISAASVDDISTFVSKARVTDKYLNHLSLTLTSMNAYGAIQNVRRGQTSRNMSVYSLLSASNLPLTVQQKSSVVPVSPLSIRGFTTSGTYSPVTWPLQLVKPFMMDGLGYPVESSAYNMRIQARAAEVGVTTRITALSTATWFNASEEVTMGQDAAGCADFNPELVSAKGYQTAARMCLYQPDAQYGDSIIGACSPAGATYDLRNSFANVRSLWPSGERYGYTVGTSQPITAVPVCGQDAVFSLHTSYSLATSERPGADPCIPIALNLRLLNSLGPQNVGKVLAIVGGLLAPNPIVPMGYVANDSSACYTHNLENIRLPGITEIRFLMPQDIRSNGLVPGSIGDANVQAWFRPTFGPCPTTNGVGLWGSANPPNLPTGSNLIMNYVYNTSNPGAGDNNVYSLTALWASYMNSSSPITLSDVMRVYTAFDNCVPFLDCMKFVAQLLDTQVWLSKPMQTDGTYNAPTLSQDWVRVRFDNTPLPNDGFAAFTLFNSYQKPISRMLAGLMVPSASPRWSTPRTVSSTSAVNVFDGPISFANQFFPMFGRATFMAHACAHQLFTYLLGRNGTDINTAYGAYTGSNSKLIGLVKLMDGSMIGTDAGQAATTQRLFERMYAASTGGCRCPKALGDFTIFGRRYLNPSYFYNPSFIPATLSIADMFFWLGHALKEWCPFPQADILVKSQYLPMGEDIGVLTSPGRAIGANNSAPLVKKTILQAFQTLGPVDANPWTDGTLSYNIDLWATAAVGATARSMAVGNALVTGQLWLYSAPIFTGAYGQSAAVEIRAMWPRISDNAYVYAINTTLPNNDAQVVNDYSYGTAQPRATWIMTPATYRPNAVYIIAQAMPSVLDTLSSSDPPTGEDSSGVSNASSYYSGFAQMVQGANLAVSGTIEPRGVIQTSNTVGNSYSVAAGSGGSESVSGAHGYNTVSGAPAGP